MSVKKVDIVFVIDASDSMKPCIDGVLENIGKMLGELGKVNYDVNLSGVVHNIPGEHVYTTYSLVSGKSIIRDLYQNDDAEPDRSNYFTGDIQKFSEKLKRVTVQGDENMLHALDCALDLPYREIYETRRAIILLSDEPFETNYKYNAEKNLEIAEKLVEKIIARNIELYMVIPQSEIANILSEAPKSSLTELNNGCDGLRDFDFSNFFMMLGKTLSVSTMQISKEKPYEKGIMGQKNFGVATSYKHINDSFSK